MSNVVLRNFDRILGGFRTICTFQKKKLSVIDSNINLTNEKLFEILINKILCQFLI